MGGNDPVDGHPHRRQTPGRGQPVEHRPAAVQLALALDQERGRMARRDSWVSRPSTVKPQAAEPPPEPALEVEKAEMQARWCSDGYAG